MLLKTTSLILATAFSVSAFGIGGAIGDLEDVTLIFESNSSDGDGEIVLGVNPDDALQGLIVFGPSGNKVLQVRSKDSGNVGFSHFNLESAEPSIAEVQAAYPEGPYRVDAWTNTGVVLSATVHLVHDLLPPPVLAFPADGTTDVPTTGVTLQWDAVPGATGYFVEFEGDDVELTATLPAGFTQLSLPDGLLEPGLEYQWQVKVTGSNGNVIATEVAFSTAG